MNKRFVKSRSDRRESGVFKTEKSAKYALLGLMAFVALCVGAFLLHAMYDRACLALGLELVFYWAYLNPWILREKYALFFFIDTSKMVHIRFLVVGGVVLIGAAVLIILRQVQ